MNLFETIDVYQNKINELRPFTGKMLDTVKNFYRVGFTWASNALEGNTLTISETKILIEDGITVGGKPLRDTLEAVGHAKSYDYMFSIINKKTITEEDILYMHKIFYNQIDENYAGVYRDVPVFISGSNYPVTEPNSIVNQMKEFCSFIKNEKKNYNIVEFVAILHKKFVFIHPFIDGNGRLARLIMNTMLIQQGYLPVIVPPIFRADYIALLERAHKDDKDFINFIAELELQSQKDFLRMLNI